MPQGHTYSGTTSANDNARQHVGDHHGDQHHTINHYYPHGQQRSDETSGQAGRDERLLKAAKEGQFSRLQYLIQLGVDIDTRNDSDGETALHRAAWGGYLDCVELLVQKGADINPTGGKFGTPLWNAACCGHTQITKYLLKQRASIEGSVDNPIGSPLHAACLGPSISGVEVANMYETIEVLLEHGADPNTRAYFFYSFNWDAFQQILKGSRVSEYVPFGEEVRPLHVAALADNVEAINILVDSGAIVARVDSPSRFDSSRIVGRVAYVTPLMLACARDHHEVASTLLKRGADPNRKDGMGRTARDNAIESNAENCIKLFRELDEQIQKSTISP